jgi:hypothetical protein
MPETQPCAITPPVRGLLYRAIRPRPLGDHYPRTGIFPGTSPRGDGAFGSVPSERARDLVFSDWIRIFKDPMTTAAAIDRLVHHAVILEMTGPSYRSEEARKRGVTTPATTTTTTDQPTTSTLPLMPCTRRSRHKASGFLNRQGADGVGHGKARFVVFQLGSWCLPRAMGEPTVPSDGAIKCLYYGLCCLLAPSLSRRRPFRHKARSP